MMAVVEGFMEAVKGSLSKDNNVYLRGFGTFEVKTRKAKTGLKRHHNSQHTTIFRFRIAIFSHFIYSLGMLCQTGLRETSDKI